VARWVAWGHRVTVVAGDYPGAKPVEQLHENLTVHRMGTRLTVFPRAARAARRGLADDADVVLEVINGIAFLTPLWARRPHVALVHHIHRDHYVAELGRRGALAAAVLETLPLRSVYRGTPFITISDAGRRDLLALKVPEEQIHVAYLGVEPSAFRDGARTPAPRLLYLGRLKQYKRIELVLDVLEGVPGALLDIAGDGDHRPALEAEIAGAACRTA
jgi:glycosyltransferase involved in cell wall biosynthesis